MMDSNHWLKIVQDANVQLIEPPSSQHPEHTILLELAQPRMTAVERPLNVELRSRGNRLIALVKPETMRSMCRQFEALDCANQSASSIEE